MQFKLSSKEKLSVYKQTRKSFEMDLIQRLCAVGIDPQHVGDGWRKELLHAGECIDQC